MQKKIQFILLYVMMISCTNTKAQVSPYEGFYDASKTELVFHLYILPNHEFAVSMIYGAVDRLIFGTWKETTGNKIILEEKRETEAPFIIYASPGKANQRILNYKYFDQNTEVAMALGNPFKATDLKYILKPDQTSFSHTYELEVPFQQSNSLHFSRQLSDLEHEVYDFNLAENDNVVLLMYNSQANQPLFTATASLVNGELMMGMENEKETPFAKKEMLPKDIEKQIAKGKQKTGIADKEEVEINNERKIFTRVKSSGSFITKAEINPQISYLENEQKDEAEDVTIPVPTLMPPANIK